MEQSTLPTKTCTKCKVALPFEAFTGQPRGRYGIRSVCRACEKVRWQTLGEPSSDVSVLKTCTVCKITLPLDAFQVNRGGLFGRRATCKACLKPKTAAYEASVPAEVRAARSRAWSQANPERKAATTRAWQRANPERTKAAWNRYRVAHPEVYTEYEARRRARNAGAPIIERIDRTAIIIRDDSTCYLCGRVLTPEQVTLDHVVALSVGGTHTADNLRVACRPCNASKGKHPLEQFLADANKGA